jgi:bla regulator protein BlaR1
MNMNQHLIESVGWTLVHSLWEGAIIFVLAFLVTRNPGSRVAGYQYAGFVVALGLVVTTSLATFFITYAGGPSVVATSVINESFGFPIATALSDASDLGFAVAVRKILAWIDLNLLWVIRAWLTGSAVLLLRMLSGVLYISLLRRNALPVAAGWEEKVNELARGLRVQRKVSIAEGRVTTPMVIGYLKPLIVFPVGMIAGLAPLQVEAILIHELAHIRRHDFVVNAIQCIVESLFFFNPFVWMISARIRVEREHCCDDIVVRRGIEPLDYVRTLATVEGAYANGGRLSLALVGQKGRLLNRMKRVMERTIVKKEWNGMRLLPLALVLVGLVCASWLSASIDANPGDINSTQSIVAADTTITSWTFRDETASDKRDNERDTHTFERPLLIPPDQSAAFPFPHGFDLFAADSLPPFGPYLSDGDWENFEKEFTEKFREEFPRFFEKNQEQFEKMMQEFNERNDEMGLMFRRMDELNHEQLRELEEQMTLINPVWENPGNFVLPPFPVEAEAEALREAAEAIAESERALAESGLFRAQEELLRWQEQFLLGQEEDLRAYEEEMVEQLTRDGYLKEGEKATDLHINNGEITVNGRKVKKEDEQKYKAIIDGHFNRMHAPRKPE